MKQTALHFHSFLMRLLFAGALLSAVCLLFLSRVCAQEPAYSIHPGDCLDLTIYAGGEVQRVVEVFVSQDGNVAAPFVGMVQAAGLTVRQLESLIAVPLAQDYFVDPKVSIRIKEFHSVEYYISGAIKSPGLYKMTSGATLMELISKAGGVLPGHGRVAKVVRASATEAAQTGGRDIEKLFPGRESIEVDLERLLVEGDMNLNMVLQAGDVVYIPGTMGFAGSKILVDGEVEAPGAYDFQPGITALTVCIMAGGFSKFAAPNRARIIRTDRETKKVEKIRIDLNDVMKGKAPDVELRPGDRIFIPETWL